MSWILIIIFSVAIVSVCVMWVTGIHHMNKHFPNYKAEDFLNDKEDEDE